jgi:hypothetical protein
VSQVPAPVLVELLLLLSIPSPDGRSVRQAEMHLFYSTRTATTIRKVYLSLSVNIFFLWTLTCMLAWLRGSISLHYKCWDLNVFRRFYILGNDLLLILLLSLFVITDQYGVCLIAE